MLVFLKDQSLDILLFLIYINDLSNGLKVNVNYLLMTLLCFFMVHDINTSASDLKKDLEKIGNWAFKWKMIFFSSFFYSFLKF